jgi:acetolactate synthase regulatory subunit
MAAGSMVTQLAREAGAYVCSMSSAATSVKPPADGLAVDFVVESDRAPPSQIVQRVRDGRLVRLISC